MCTICLLLYHKIYVVNRPIPKEAHTVEEIVIKTNVNNVHIAHVSPSIAMLIGRQSYYISCEYLSIRSRGKYLFLFIS